MRTMRERQRTQRLADNCSEEKCEICSKIWITNYNRMHVMRAHFVFLRFVCVHSTRTFTRCHCRERAHASERPSVSWHSQHVKCFNLILNLFVFTLNEDGEERRQLRPNGNWTWTMRTLMLMQWRFNTNKFQNEFDSVIFHFDISIYELRIWLKVSPSINRVHSLRQSQTIMKKCTSNLARVSAGAAQCTLHLL